MKRSSNKLLSFSIAITLAIVFLLSACGYSEAMDSGDNSDSVSEVKISEESLPSANSHDSDYLLAGTDPQILNSEKIIYSGIADIETQDFDKTISGIENLIASCNGYIQSSSVHGNDYNSSVDGIDYRSASYVLRIPIESFKDVFSGLSTLGNVPFSSINADNITLQYTDAQARLKAREAEEARLLTLLTEAENVDEMLSIEHYLSDVRYEIESLLGQIKGWDNHISYSSLTLNVSEVSLYTEGASGSQSYGSQLVSALTVSARQVWHFLKSLLKVIVAALPVMAVILLLAVPLFFLFRAVVKLKAQKYSKASEDKGNPSEQQSLNKNNNSRK